MHKAVFISMAALTLATLACGSRNTQQLDPTPDSNTTTADLNIDLPEGDPAQGESLFTGKADDEFPCWVCHSLTPGQSPIGPSLAGIGTAAATRVEGYLAEQYLYESIVSPDAYIVEGYQPNLMPQEFAAGMDKQQLADIIAFLITQK